MADDHDNQFGAAESFLGQSYQIWYALYFLLQAGRKNPNACVSVELIDDVARHDDGKLIEVVQTKRTQTDLTDTSVPLWKTLRIWSEEIVKGSIDPASTAFSLVTTSVAPEGSAASYLRRSGRNQSKALAQLENAAEESENKVLQKAFLAFEKLGSRKRDLIKSITVVDRSPDFKDLKKDIGNELLYATPPDREQEFIELLGQRWRSSVDDSLATLSPISCLGVRHLMADLGSQFQADNLPLNFRDRLPPQINTADHRFIKQLALLQLDDRSIAAAGLDYMRAYEQRSIWSRKKIVGVDEIPSYDKRILEECTRRHNLVRAKTAKDGDEAKIQAGLAHYEWATMHGINYQMFFIRSKCVEPYVIRGTMQILANREKDGIGWHPDYESLLAKAVGEQE